MELLILGIGIIVVVFVSRIVLLGLWKAIVTIHNDGPSFVSKIFVSVGSAFVGGFAASAVTGASFELSGLFALGIASAVAIFS